MIVPGARRRGEKRCSCSVVTMTSMVAESDGRATTPRPRAPYELASLPSSRPTRGCCTASTGAGDDSILSRGRGGEGEAAGSGRPSQRPRADRPCTSAERPGGQLARGRRRRCRATRDEASSASVGPDCVTPEVYRHGGAAVVLVRRRAALGVSFPAAGAGLGPSVWLPV